MAIGKILVAIGLTKLVATGVIALGISTGLFKGCSDKGKLDDKLESQTVQTVSIPVSGFGGDFNTVQYNGMVNDSVFALSTSSSFAVNQYYKLSSKKIYFYGTNYDVKKVTPDSLILQYVKH